MTKRFTGLTTAAVLAIATPLALTALTAPAGALPAGYAKTGMICLDGTLAGSTRTFNLVAEPGYMQTPDGNSLFMWSYGNVDAPDNSDFQYPGPVLCAKQGETVTVNLHNTLPEASSIVFPGQSGVTSSGGSNGLLAREAAATNGNVSYTFTAGNPGTFAYESGSDVGKQLEMGLYGALVVRPAGHDNWAYGSSGTQFDPKHEFLVLLSDIDADLHHAVETNAPYDLNTRRDRYFAVNGRSFPDTLQDNNVSWLPGQPYGSLVRIQPSDSTLNPQPALIRMLNLGLSNHPYHPHGDHLTQVGQDGRQLLSPTGADASSERFGETIGSGQTQDYLLKWNDVDKWDPNVTARQLPVAQPNYRNLTFKDGNTWYSGSPYLGYKGTLPTGTVSQNICGEWYFPWHSHALNEFTNFDQGFGGMATLLRVDPLGGCFAFPTASKVLAGTASGGTVANLAVDDTKFYTITSATTPTPPTGQHTDWYGQFTAPAGSTNFVATYKGRNNSTTQTGCCSVTLSFWNWGTSSWNQVGGPTSIGAAEVQMSSTPVANPAAYIGTGTNRGVVRVRVLTTRTGTAAFTTNANLLKLVYDAP